MRLVDGRARLMGALPEGGGMMSVSLPPDELDVPDGLDIAAVNGPRSTVVSGDQDALDALASVLSDAGVRCRRLRVSHAFHSHRMNPMLEEFRALVNDIPMSAPGVALCSAMSEGQPTEADFWVRHVREPVRFDLAVARAEGIDTWVEVGLHTTLACLLYTSPSPRD